MFPVIKTLVFFLSDKRDENLNFTAVDENDIRKIADKLDNKKSCGIDGISNIIMKSIINILIKPVTIIINQMLETGVFPDKLKVTKVIPLFEKGDPTLLTNYRPNYLLSSLSKIFENTNNYMLILKTQTCSLKVNMAFVKVIPLKWHL